LPAVRRIATIILRNRSNEFLLYLRDDKPEIPFPNRWDLFGGHVEPGESVEEALARELREELDLALDQVEFFRTYDCREGDAFPNVKYVYSAVIDKRCDDLVLREGQRLAYFTAREIPGLPIANILKQVLLDFIAARGLAAS
jgi:8-oxo-dGTP diphosphatase